MPAVPSVEDVHSLRTHTRQIEAAFSALDLHSGSSPRKLLDQMKKVRRRAGKVRDMDVLIGYSSSVHVENEKDCAVALLEELGAGTSCRTPLTFSATIENSLQRHIAY